MGVTWRSRLVFPYLVLSALIGSVHLILPAALALLPLPFARPRRAYRGAVRCVARAWFTLAASLLERESAVHVSGQLPAPADRCTLMLCNHNSRVDWMYIWVLVARYGTSADLRIALKSSLRSAPFFGWAMQAFLFVFLSRHNRERDLTEIRDVLGYVVHTLHEPTSFLLFPEGTDLSPSNLKKAKAWAAAHGRPQFHHLLQPRSAGFIETVRAMGDALDAVYDITVTYTLSGGTAADKPESAAADDPSTVSYTPLRPSEVDMLRGRFPEAVRLHMHRYSRSELPTSDEALAQWLEERWRAKESFITAALAAQASSLDEAVVQPVADYARFRLLWGVASVVVVLGFTIVPILPLPTIIGCVLLAIATRFWGGLGAIEMATTPRAITREVKHT